MLAAVRRRIFPLRPGALTAAFSATSAANPALSYLISRCGLSPSAAARAANSVRLASPRAAAQADAVLALLRRYGFSDADISSAVRQVPILLTADPAKTLQPKLDFLASVGIQTPLLQRVVLLSPVIFFRSVENHLEPFFASLREVLGSNAGIVAALNRKPFVIRCQPKSTLFRIVPLLREVHGLSATDVSKLIAFDPSIILMPPNRVNEVVELAKKFGVEPGNPKFVRVFGALSNMKVPKLESKLALYLRLGFDNKAVTLMIRRFPSTIAFSEKKTAEIIEFLTDKAGLTHEDIITYPTLLGRRLEALSWKCAVLAVLRRAGKQLKQHRLPSLLNLSDKWFLEEYVQPHVEDVPDVLGAMNGEIPFHGFDSLEEKPKLLSKLSA